jgi:hemoglobin
MTTLYEKVGGEETVAKVVDEFYKRVLADQTVSPFFKETDMDRQRRHQTAFISFALGGKAYTGKSMAVVHKGMNLQPQHFDTIVKLLSETLSDFRVSQEDVRQIAAKVETLREDILYK